MSKTLTRRREGFSLLRVLICAALLTALVAGCLYLYYTALEFLRARLLDDESKTLAWLTGQLGFSLPFFLICLFQLMVYHGHDSRDGSARREMFWEVALVTVLTYAVLLPYLSSISEALYINALAAGEIIPETDGGVEITLLMELHEWFVRLTIPLGILLIYHAARARRERLYPETEADPAPLMTVAEYEAMKAAEVSAAEVSAAEISAAEVSAGEEPQPSQHHESEDTIHES